MSHLDRDFRQYVKKVSKITVKVGILVRNEVGEVLLQQRAGSDEWGIPLGSMTPGESLEDAARRELWEETALTADDVKLLRMFSGPEFQINHSSGDEEFLVIGLYEAEGLQTELNTQTQVNKALRFFGAADIPSLDMLTMKLLSAIHYAQPEE